MLCLRWKWWVAGITSSTPRHFEFHGSAVSLCVQVPSTNVHVSHPDADGVSDVHPDSGLRATATLCRCPAPSTSLCDPLWASPWLVLLLVSFCVVHARLGQAVTRTFHTHRPSRSREMSLHGSMEAVFEPRTRTSTESTAASSTVSGHHRWKHSDRNFGAAPPLSFQRTRLSCCCSLMVV